MDPQTPAERTELLPYTGFKSSQESTVVLLHGATSSPNEYRLVVPMLASYHVLVPTLPGHDPQGHRPGKASTGPLSSLHAVGCHRKRQPAGGRGRTWPSSSYCGSFARRSCWRILSCTICTTCVVTSRLSLNGLAPRRLRLHFRALCWGWSILPAPCLDR